MVRNCPKGLGNPVFDKLEAELAKAMLSLPATKVRQESKFAHTCTYHPIHSAVTAAGLQQACCYS